MRNDPIWIELRDELASIYGQAVELVFPQSWTYDSSMWFKEIEKHSFRSELQYRDEEIQERLRMEGLLLLFISVQGRPEALILGYHLDESVIETFYLDTIAVRMRGKGVGPTLMRWLMKWAKKNGYERIALDTELENESGLRLRDFYRKLGFIEGHIDENGNIPMSISL
jgi:ribosomal protein S18 acetylase RimI-like enzyme